MAQSGNREQAREDAAAVRVLLTHDRIVRAAVELIEREGADALSMRRVAAELGVAVMSLYNHVPSKAALLDGVAERIAASMEIGDSPATDWRERARALARAFRKVARDHPRCVTLMLTRKLEMPAGIRPVEHALDIADQAGFDGETAVRLTRTLLAYAMGAQMRELRAEKMYDYLTVDPAEQFNHLDPAVYPHVVSLAPLLVQQDPEGDFEFGLELLIYAMDALPRRDKTRDSAARDAPAVDGEP